MSDSKPKATPSKTYTAVVGISTADGERYEAGDQVPAALVQKNKWLVERGKVK